MKKELFILVVMLLVACKQTSDKKEETSQIKLEILKTYPENISKVFKAHGSIDVWNGMNSLKFTIPKENGNEVTTTHLKSRKSLIEMPKHILGYDGEQVWLKNKDTVQYKGNAKFYYNLMFYFYAMPFVLGDDGIRFSDVEPLEFEGASYPGIKISYDNGVGESPEDEYVLYYNPDTYRMEWLGYTVTYFSKEKSKDFHFIKYGDWQTIEGLLLPKTLTWFNYENNMPTTKRSDRVFTNVLVSKEKPSDTLFEMPKGAKAIN